MQVSLHSDTQASVPSFEQTLDKVMGGTPSEEYNAEEAYKSRREIERKMEDFDREKKQKAARSEADLGRLVITA